MVINVWLAGSKDRMALTLESGKDNYHDNGIINDRHMERINIVWTSWTDQCRFMQISWESTFSIRFTQKMNLGWASSQRLFTDLNLISMIFFFWSSMFHSWYLNLWHIWTQRGSLRRRLCFWKNKTSESISVLSVCAYFDSKHSLYHDIYTTSWK